MRKAKGAQRIEAARAMPLCLHGAVGSCAVGYGFNTTLMQSSRFCLKRS